MNIQKVNMISDNDWDELVKKTYNRPYCFQQQDDCKERGTFDLIVPSKYTGDFERDTIPEIVNHREMGVSFKAWLERDPKAPLKDEKEGKDGTLEWMINMWWERNFYPSIEMIANDLHSKGLLDAGEYVIDIDW